MKLTPRGILGAAMAPAMVVLGTVLGLRAVDHEDEGAPAEKRPETPGKPVRPMLAAHKTTGWLHAETDEETAFEATFSYDAGDPFAVTAYMGGHRWVLSRDLLFSAFEAEGEQGEGWVRAHCEAEDNVYDLTLYAPSMRSSSVVRFEATEVLEFLALTESITPRGQEPNPFDTTGAAE